MRRERKRGKGLFFFRFEQMSSMETDVEVGELL